MKVTQEKLPASQIGLEIEISPEASKQAYEKTLQDFTRYANIPGFRKGKVPRQVLIQRFGSSRIKAAALEELIPDLVRKAIEQEEIKAIGNFELRSSYDDLVKQFEPGGALTVAIAVDVQPEVKLNQYKDLQVQAEEVQYDPERVDKVLEDYRKRSATLVPVEERPAQAEDVATVDFAGRLVPETEGEEGAEIPGGSAQDFQIELTEGRFIPGFIDGIIGMTPGETKEVEAKFPDDYPQQDLAGKAAVFTITLKELKQRELPELDDDFAQEVSEFETLAELRESLETRFKEEAEQKTKSNRREALLTELAKHVEVELPETLVRQEVDYAVTQTAMQFSEQGFDVRKTFTQEIVSMLRDQARPDATNRLLRTLALREIGKQESLEVTSEEVDAKVQEVMGEFSGQEQRELDGDRLRSMLEEDLLRDKILGWLEEHNSIEMVPEGSLQAEASPAAEEVAEAAESASDPSAATVEVAAEPVAEAEEAPEAVEETAEAEEPAAKKTKKAKGSSNKSK